MSNETRMSFPPTLHLGMLVRAVVIHHDVEFDLARKFLVQPFEKLEEFLMLVRRAFCGLRCSALWPSSGSSMRSRTLCLVPATTRLAGALAPPNLRSICVYLWLRSAWMAANSAAVHRRRDHAYLC